MHSRAAASVESKMATMQHKIFCVREFIKTESATAVQRAFRLRSGKENIQITMDVQLLYTDRQNLQHWYRNLSQ